LVIGLIARMPARTPLLAAALVVPSASHEAAARWSVELLGLVVPMTALAAILLAQQNLSRHRRALFAALPDAMGARLASWFFSAMGLAIVAAIVGDVVPSALGLTTAPWDAALWLLPAAGAVSGQVTWVTGG
jgi:hypothetical protein